MQSQTANMNSQYQQFPQKQTFASVQPQLPLSQSQSNNVVPSTVYVVPPQHQQQQQQQQHSSPYVQQQQQGFQQLINQLPQQQTGIEAVSDWETIEQFLDEQEKRQETNQVVPESPGDQGQQPQLSYLQESPSSAVRRIADTLRNEVSPTRAQTPPSTEQAQAMPQSQLDNALLTGLLNNSPQSRHQASTAVNMETQIINARPPQTRPQNLSQPPKVQTGQNARVSVSGQSENKARIVTSVPQKQPLETNGTSELSDDPSRLSPKSFQNMLDSIISQQTVTSVSRAQKPHTDNTRAQPSTSLNSFTTQASNSNGEVIAPSITSVTSTQSQQVNSHISRSHEHLMSHDGGMAPPIPLSNTISARSTPSSDHNWHHCAVHGLVPIIDGRPVQIKTEPGVRVKTEPVDSGYEKSMTYKPNNVSVKVEVKEEPIEKETSVSQSKVVESDSGVSSTPIGSSEDHPPPIAASFRNERSEPEESEDTQQPIAASENKETKNSSHAATKKRKSPVKVSPVKNIVQQTADSDDDNNVNIYSDDSGICSRPSSRSTPLQKRKGRESLHTANLLEVRVVLHRLDDIVRGGKSNKKEDKTDASDSEVLEDREVNPDSECDSSKETSERTERQKDPELKPDDKTPKLKELVIVLDNLTDTVGKSVVKPKVGATPPAKVRLADELQNRKSPVKHQVDSSPLAKVKKTTELADELQKSPENSKVGATPPPKVKKGAELVDGKSPMKSKVGATPPPKVTKCVDKTDELQNTTPELRELRIVLDKDVIRRDKDGVSHDNENTEKSDTSVIDSTTTDDDEIVRKRGRPRKRQRIVSDSEGDDVNTGHDPAHDTTREEVSKKIKYSRSKSITGSETDEYEDDSEVQIPASTTDKESKSRAQSTTEEDSKSGTQSPTKEQPKSQYYVCVNLVSGPIRDKKFHLQLKFQPLVNVVRPSDDYIKKWTNPKKPCVKAEPKEISEQTKSKPKDAQEHTEGLQDKCKLKDIKIMLDKDTLEKVSKTEILDMGKCSKPKRQFKDTSTSKEQNKSKGNIFEVIEDLSNRESSWSRSRTSRSRSPSVSKSGSSSPRVKLVGSSKVLSSGAKRARSTSKEGTTSRKRARLDSSEEKSSAKKGKSDSSSEKTKEKTKQIKKEKKAQKYGKKAFTFSKLKNIFPKKKGIKD